MTNIDDKNQAYAFFQSLSKYSDLEQLITIGEAEGQYLECKSRQVAQVEHNDLSKIAKYISGFANTGGGVIIWGVATTEKSQPNLDVLTQIEPLGSSQSFAKDVDRVAARSTEPTLRLPPSKILHSKRGESKGVVITFIPTSFGDPIRSIRDKRFYYRNGDKFNEMPYEMLRRMFAGSTSPDLHPVFQKSITVKNSEGIWTIPLTLENHSSVVAKDIEVVVNFVNDNSCESISSDRGFSDSSDLNVGMRIFISNAGSIIIHRGLNKVIGKLFVKMKGRNELLKMELEIFASDMTARKWSVNIHLSKTEFSVKQDEEIYLY